MPLKWSAIWYKQRKQKYFSLPEYQLGENLILTFLNYEREKKDKGGFVVKLIGTIVQLFLFENVSPIGSKIFATQRFCTDHLKRKNINKRTCRNTQKISANSVLISWRNFQLLWLFLRISEFLDLNSPSFIFQRFSTRAM